MQYILEAEVNQVLSNHEHVESAVYVDDVALAAPRRYLQPALKELLQRLATVHLPPAAQKTIEATQSLPFLGHRVVIGDPIANWAQSAGTISLLPERRKRLSRQVRAMMRKLRRPKPGLQLRDSLRRLLGRLVFTTPAVTPGPAHLRALYALLHQLENQRSPHSWWTNMASHAINDLKWWRDIMDVRQPGPNRPFPRAWHRDLDAAVWSDASTTGAGAIVYWKNRPVLAVYANYARIPARLIYRAEAAIIGEIFRILLHSDSFPSHIKVWTDNKGACFTWQARRARDPPVNSMLKTIHLDMARKGVLTTLE